MPLHHEAKNFVSIMPSFMLAIPYMMNNAHVEYYASCVRIK